MTYTKKTKVKRDLTTEKNGSFIELKNKKIYVPPGKVIDVTKLMPDHIMLLPDSLIRLIGNNCGLSKIKQKIAKFNALHYRLRKLPLSKYALSQNLTCLDNDFIESLNKVEKKFKKIYHDKS